MKVGQSEATMVELRGHDERMVEAFRAAGSYSSFTAADYETIGSHRSVCYLVEENGGTIEASTRLAEMAVAFLRAGGYGVKVESAGRAHTPTEWLESFDSDDYPPRLVDSFVTWLSDGDRFMSCGMHNLGHPDVSAPSSLGPTAALGLLRAFCFFEVVDNPVLHQGETFAAALGEPLYRLRHVPSPYVPDGLFWNEHGVWDLEPV